MTKAAIATVTSIEEFRVWVNRVKRPGSRWIYRGQGDPRWQLRTSLERAFVRTPPKGITQRRAEEVMLREFRRHCHRFVRCRDVADDLEWLALMQHYGAPTRLLDWTWSENIALFFALGSAAVRRQRPDGQYKLSCAVWAINQKACWRRFTDSLKHEAPTMYARLKDNDKDSEALNFVLSNEWKEPLVAPLNPFRIDQRRHMQQSTFLVPLATGSPFGNNLDNTIDRADCCKVVVEVSGERLPLLLMELRRANVTPLTLSPDVEGLAGSVWQTAYLPELRPKPVNA